MFIVLHITNGSAGQVPLCQQTVRITVCVSAYNLHGLVQALSGTFQNFIVYISAFVEAVSLALCSDFSSSTSAMHHLYS